MFILRVFGGAVLEGPAGRVTGGAAQRRRIALLVLLTRARSRPLGREKLIGLLWPEHSTDAARHLLAQALYAVRKALPQEPFVTPGDEVGLDEQVLTSDANVFEDAIAAGELERAVEHYRGDFLDGFFLPEAGEFERWVEEERTRLRRAHGQALERLAEAAEANGEPLNAAGWWQRASEHEPYSSRLVLRLMRALEWGGEHLAAIRAAEKHAEFLREDIGASPDPEVLASAERLRINPPPGRLAPLPAPDPIPAPQSRHRNEEATGLPEPVPATEGIPAGAPEVVDGAPSTSSSAQTPARVTVERARAPARPLLLVALFAILVAVATLASGLLPDRKARSAAAAYGHLDPRRIAVLYFDDLSEHQDAGHIAAGLTEALIHELAQVPSLNVVSRNGVKPFRDRAVPFDSIVAALNAGSVVEGSVQRSGGRLRVTVQLIDGSTGTHLQSRTLIRPMTELLALEEDLGVEVSRFLRERLGEEIQLREHASETRSVQAREALMRAQTLLIQNERAAGEPDPLGPAARVRALQRADSLLVIAEREDPKWLDPALHRGWVSLALAETRPGPERAGDLMRSAAHAERVLIRFPGHPEALELRGTARWRLARMDVTKSEGELRGLLAAAEEDLKRALEADPSRATAWSTLSQYLRLQGRIPEADVAARRALEADEFLAEADLILERLYRSALLAGRYDEALKWCDEGGRRFPTNWRFVECELTLLGYGRGTSEDIARAWALRGELEQLDPTSSARASERPYSPIFRDMNVAMVLARAGFRDSARAVVARARRAAGGAAELTTSLAYDRARVAYVLGDTAQTLQLLAGYVAAKPRLREYVAQDVTFTRLREHPRFRAIVTPPSPAQNP